MARESILTVLDLAPSTLTPAISGSKPESRRLPLTALFGLLVLYSALYSRIFTALGAPAVIKFAHFALAMASMVIAAPTLRARHSKQLLCGVLLLLFSIASSALVNGAGLINLVLDFTMLSEPFLLIILLGEARLSESQFDRIDWSIRLCVWCTVAASWYQYLVLHRDNDDIKGIFIDEPGAHVNGAVAMTFAVYVLSAASGRKRWFDLLLAALSFGVVIVSDSKQVIVVFLGSMLALAGTRRRTFRQVAKYAGAVVLACLALVVVAIFFLPSMIYYSQSQYIALGLSHKLSVFSILASHYESPLNWLVGLGPGHTVGRLAWIMPSYLPYLDPWGITTSSVSREVFAMNASSWLSGPRKGTSFWVLMFSWAGVWGDLGALGVAALGGLWTTLWRNLRSDEVGRFFVLNILVFGMVHAWMEEPGYMLFVATLLGMSLARSRALA